MYFRNTLVNNAMYPNSMDAIKQESKWKKEEVYVQFFREELTSASESCESVTDLSMTWGSSSFYGFRPNFTSMTMTTMLLTLSEREKVT